MPEDRIYILGHSILAFVSMFILTRSWGMSSYGSALSALAYAFSAPVLFLADNVIYLVGAAWLPLGFHSAYRWVSRGRRWGLWELTFVLSMLVLGGDVEAAYLLGVASAFFAGCVAWSRSGLKIENSDRPKTNVPRRALERLILAIVVAFWCFATLAVALWLPRLREPGVPRPPLRFSVWVPWGISAIWGLVVLGVVMSWWRRGRRFPMGVMWLGLAGSAALSAVLAAAQLLPVIEFTQETGRANPGPEEIYRFSLDPYQLVELVWPNFFGPAIGGNDYWRDILPMPGYATMPGSLRSMWEA